MTTTAKTTFAHLATLIATTFQPPVRGERTAATFTQFGEIAGDLPLSVADAYEGFRALGFTKGPDEPGNVKGRRTTCHEVAVLLAGEGAGREGNTGLLAAVFDAVAAHFAGTSDGREAAIAETARREASELRAA